MGVASSADCVGGGGYNGKHPARAPSVDGEPTHDHARGQLMTISRHFLRRRLPTERFEDFSLATRRLRAHLAGRFEAQNQAAGPSKLPGYAVFEKWKNLRHRVSKGFPFGSERRSKTHQFCPSPVAVGQNLIRMDLNHNLKVGKLGQLRSLGQP